jgi:hypothetical protein
MVAALVKTHPLVRRQVAKQAEIEAFQRHPRGRHYSDEFKGPVTVDQVYAKAESFFAVNRKPEANGDFAVWIDTDLETTMKYATHYKRDHPHAFDGITVYRFSTSLDGVGICVTIVPTPACNTLPYTINVEKTISTIDHFSNSYISPTELAKVVAKSLPQTLTFSKQDISDYCNEMIEVGPTAIKHIKESLLTYTELEPKAKEMIKQEDAAARAISKRKTATSKDDRPLKKHKASVSRLVSLSLSLSLSLSTNTHTLTHHSLTTHSHSLTHHSHITHTH